MTTEYKKLGKICVGDVYAKKRSHSNDGRKECTLTRYYLIQDIINKETVQSYFNMTINASNSIEPHFIIEELIELDGQFEFLETTYRKPTAIPFAGIFNEHLEGAEFYCKIESPVNYDTFVDTVMKSKYRTAIVWSVTNMIFLAALIVTSFFA